jgi:hypothetical protein
MRNLRQRKLMDVRALSTVALATTWFYAPEVSDEKSAK